MKLLLDMKAFKVTVSTPFLSSVPSEGPDAFEADTTRDISVSAFLGTEVFATSVVGNLAAEEEREAIGKIRDLIFTRDGAVKAVVLDVSTYIGTPNKLIDIDLKNLIFASEPTDPSRLVLCVKTDERLLRKLASRIKST